MKYKCVKEFYVTKYDDDGFPTSEYIDIKEGSKWWLSDSSHGLSEITLEQAGGTLWIEVTKDRLNEYFELLE